MDYNNLPDNPNWMEAFARPQKQPEKKKGGRGGTLTSLISEGGALGGAALGASIGSVVPVFGTAIGGILGAGIGAFGGRLAENQVRDERWGLGDAAKEGLMSGALAGPLRALKYGSTAVKGVKGGANLSDALIEAATKSSGPGIIRTAIANRTSNAADGLASKAFGLTKGQKNKIYDKTGVKAGAIARQYGVTSVEEIPLALKPLQDEFDNAVNAIPVAFTKKEVSQAFKKVYAPLIKKGMPTGQQAIGQRLKAEADNIVSGIKGNVIAPAELNSKRQLFDNLAYQLRATDPSAADVNKMSRDVIARLVRDAADKSGIKTADGLSLRQVGQEINKLKLLEDAAKKNIEGPGGSSFLGVGNTPGTIIGSGFGPVGAAGGFAASAALNSPVGRKAVFGVANAATKRASKVADKSGTLLGNIKGMSRNLTGVNLADAIIGQSSENSAAQMTPTIPTSMNAPMNANMMGQQYSNSPQMSSNGGGITRESALEAMIMDISATGGANLKTIQALYEFANAGAEEQQISQSSKNALASSDNAINTVDQLENLFTNAGGGSGRIGGSVKGLAANMGFDEDAKVYTSLANASVTQIAKALAGSGSGTVSDMDAKVIMAALPTLRDTPVEARAKFAALRQRLENAKNNTLLYGGGAQAPSSLEDALMQYQ